MSMTEPVRREPTSLHLQWGPIVAGAFAAAALALVLHAFASAIGLAVSSTAPTWRDTSFALVLLSGLYLLLAAIVSYGVGGYVAGRLAGRAHGETLDEGEIRDGAHGLITWALATLLAGLMAYAAAQSLLPSTQPNGGATQQSAGSSGSGSGESLISYELDRLFRSERPLQGDIGQARAEAGRVLLTAPSHRGVAPEDRTWLIKTVAARTGVAEPEATRRVDEVIGRAADSIRRARRTAVVIGFMTGAAALLGALVAWFAAVAGGRHRDGETAPEWLSTSHRTTTVRNLR